MKHEKKYSRALAAIAALALTATLLTSSPAGAQHLEEGELVASTREAAARVTDADMIDRPVFTLVPCLQFTDSIVRLYSAYFLRAPELGGFEFWQEEFEAGRWGLPRMSTFFSQSDEFVGLYGSLTDAEFIDLIYQNIFGRPADAGGRDFWLGRMQNDGIDRGTVMLNFSESPEYIELSATLASPAGYFNWYPEGTQFSCGYGDATYEVKPGLPFLDVVLFNFDDDPIVVTYEVRQGNTWVQVQESTLRSGGNLQAFGWDISNGTINGLRFTATGNFNWSVAQSPTVTPQSRVGWEPI